MAADGKDHENELLFNAHEIAARRFWIDKPGTLWRPGARFWLGWLYGAMSDYGRSIARPLLGWLLTVGLFWGVFLFGTTDKEALAHGRQCHPAHEAVDGPSAAPRLALGGPAGQALILSFRNSIVIDRAEPSTSRRMYGCLYGMTGTGRGGNGATLPVIPPVVTMLSALQSVLAAVFLFLAGLAVRNTFRIK